MFCFLLSTCNIFFFFTLLFSVDTGEQRVLHSGAYINVNTVCLWSNWSLVKLSSFLVMTVSDKKKVGVCVSHCSCTFQNKLTVGVMAKQCQKITLITSMEYRRCFYMLQIITIKHSHAISFPLYDQIIHPSKHSCCVKANVAVPNFRPPSDTGAQSQTSTKKLGWP